MIFTLSQEQINQIKNGLFPDMSDSTNIVDLKNCILKSSGTDNIFKLNLIIKDSLTNSEPIHGKIFNNKTSQKMMKMVFFEILNNNIRNQALACKTSLDLEVLIRNYGLKNYYLSPSFDFDGHKTRSQEHEIENNYIILSYKKDFILPEPKIEYFSLGVAIFYDFEIYSKEQNINPEFIEKQILFGGVKVFDLIEQFNIKPIVTDLRMVKSLFNNYRIDSQFISSNNDMGNQTLSLLENINIDNRINKNVTKLLSEKQKTINNNVYFSNVYYSRNVDGKLSFLFNLDYKNLIANNTSYKKYILNSSLPDEFINSVSLSSIKILRRRIVKSTKKDKPKIYNKNDTQTVIITAKEEKATGLVDHKQSGLFTIKENSLSLSNEKSSLRTFEVMDLEVFGLGAGMYQYGVEVMIEDVFFDKLLQKIGESRQDIVNLNKYYEETQKTIKFEKTYDATKIAAPPPVYGGRPVNNWSSTPIIESRKGVYDPVTNSFTKEFMTSYSQSYRSSNEAAVVRFIGLLELFGFKVPLPNYNINMITDLFVSMLSPSTASSETISFFIKTYQNFVNKLEKIFSDINKNKQTTIQYWFSNDYVNVEEPITIGYEFIDNEQKIGLGVVSVEQLQSIIERQILKYSRTGNAEDVSIDNNKFNFISPSKVYTPNRVLNFDAVIDSPNQISQYEYAEAEIDIKRYNLLNNAGNNVTVTNLPYSLPPRQQELNLRMNNIMHNLSISIPSMLLTPVKGVNSLNSANDNRVVYNSKVDPAYLFLSLAKNINIGENKIEQKNKDIPYIDDTQVKRLYKKEYETLVPMQIKFLIENKGKLLSQEDNYINSLDLNSIFLFFYNSIHTLEYLNYSIDKNGNHILKDEYWLKLDERNLRKISEEDLSVLCRLKVYQDSKINVNNWEDIKLPIYNQYFLLSGNPSNFSKRNPSPRTFNGFNNVMRNIINDSTTNSLIRGLAPPPPAPPPTTSRKLEYVPNKFTDLVSSFTPKPDLLEKITINKPSVSVSSFKPNTDKTTTNINIETIKGAADAINTFSAGIASRDTVGIARQQRPAAGSAAKDAMSATSASKALTQDGPKGAKSGEPPFIKKTESRQSSGKNKIGKL